MFLIPGFPKDLLCYLFGLSPMPFWVFALTSTLGRMPGTWVLSAQGAKTAGGHYVQIAVLTALVAAAALPLYHYRHQLVTRFRTAPGRSGLRERSAAAGGSSSDEAPHRAGLPAEKGSQS